MGHKKDALFLRFSTNLSLFFQNFKTCRIDLPESGGYICPIGFSMHSVDDLLEGSANQLTLEHSPPDSLDGKAICLVRKDINSTTGHSIDKKIFDWIQAKGFKEGKIGIRGIVNLGLPKLKNISGDISIAKEHGEVLITVNPGDKNFKLLKKEVFDKGIWDGQQFKVELKFQEKIGHSQKAAFLKYAYLLAFSKVGYSLLFGPKWLVNPHFEKVRRQIINPNENIIQDIPVILNKGPRIDGLGIVTDPEELRSLFVTFPVSYKGLKYYYTVILPAPDDGGFSSYPVWIKKLSSKENFDFQFEEIRPFDFSKSPKDAIWFHSLLREYLG